MLNEQLVELTESSKIIIEPVYYLQGIPHAIPNCYLRETVVDKIIRISQKLPDGYQLKIYDAWRPFLVQKYLYDAYKAKLSQQYPALSALDLDQLTKTFVSEPIYDIMQAPAHCTGGAIDLTLVYNGKDVDMGTAFDDFTPQAHTQTYIDDSIKAHRDMLLCIMTNEGFTNLETEWWHFDYGDKFWAERTRQPIQYGGIFTPTINGKIM